MDRVVSPSRRPSPPPPSGSGPAAPAIALQALTKRYGNAAAVDHLSLDIAAGSVCGLLGGNGAGKTTTIGMIMGLILPTSGGVRVLGADMLVERHTVLGRINFESPYVDLPHRLTIRQNLAVFGRLYGVRGITARIAAVAEELALTDLLDRASGQLSAGQKTRVALAKAMINEPELLLLDEPTASLDPDTADWIRSRLQAYQRRRGATVLLASHNMGEVERLCDRVIFMNAGSIVADDTPRALLDRFGRQHLEDVFLDVVRGRAGTPREAAQ